MQKSRLFTLSPRLACVSEYVQGDARLVDIGTDHALLPIHLLKTGALSCAVATELREEPYRRACENRARYGLEDKLRLILCDGFDGVDPDSVDTAVIAGMGGETIAGILERAPWTIRLRLILQPMTGGRELRRFLYQSGRIIEDETAVSDSGHVYTVICTRSGHGGHTGELYERASARLLEKNTPDTAEYLKKAARAAQNELRGLTPGSEDYIRVRSAAEKLDEIWRSILL